MDRTASPPLGVVMGLVDKMPQGPTRYPMCHMHSLVAMVALVALVYDVPQRGYERLGRHTRQYLNTTEALLWPASRRLYSSVAERQSCKLKVLGSIPSGG